MKIKTYGKRPTLQRVIRGVRHIFTPTPKAFISCGLVIKHDDWRD